MPKAAIDGALLELKRLGPVRPGQDGQPRLWR
jgi:hypothetical protein